MASNNNNDDSDDGWKAYDYDDSDLEMIRKHRAWKSAVHVGDADVRKRSLHTKLSTLDILREYGINVQSKPHGGHYHMRQQALLFMKKLGYDDSDEFFIESMMQSRYPPETENSKSTTAPRNPIHDIYSHHRSCFEYMADNLPKRQVKKRRSVTQGSNLVVDSIY